MSVTIHRIGWKSTYLEIEYSATQGERLSLYRVKSSRFSDFEIEPLRNGNLLARLNVVLGCDREVLERGEWIICTRIDYGLLNDLGALLEAKPHLRPRIEHDIRRQLPKDVRGDDEVAGRMVERLFPELGLNIIRRHPYDTYDITYDTAVLNRLDNLDRAFRYGKNHYVYVGVFVPKKNLLGDIFLVLDMTFYRWNKNPRRRSGSRRQIEKDIFALCYKVMTSVVPRKRNRILFLKENGDAPTENMEALHHRMLERGMDHTFDIRMRCRDVFSGKQNLFAWLGDLLAIASSHYIFVDDYTPVFNFIDPGRDAVLTQIWHAGVGFKSVGYARFGLKGSPDPYNSAHRRYTYALVGNEHLRRIYSEVFGIEEEALLATGMPRLDHFLDEGVAKRNHDALVSRYPWMGKGRVVVFAPTFRGTGQRTAYYPYDEIDMDRLYRMCERTDTYFVFEMHHFIKKRPDIPPEYADRIFDLSDENLNELFFVADVLVTDYSSCFYDYLLLKKPVVFFVPDKTAYSLIRGVQRSIDEMAPGTICNTFDEFIDVLEHKKYEAVKPHPSSIDRAIERGQLASDRAIDTIIYGRNVPGVRKQPC